MEEEWRDIDGYEGLYQVSNGGIIKSMYRGGRILKLKHGHNGYNQCGLFKNRKQRWYKVSRVVAKAFIPNPDNKPTVNHIDGCKTNNSVVNLEWMTHSEQNNHALRTGLWKVKSGEENPLYGRHLTEEHKKKIGDGGRGRVQSAESVAKRSISNTGKKHTQDFRRKKSIEVAEWWRKKKEMQIMSEVV